MTAPSSAEPPRERILAKALELFYRQGYSHTGINQIIEEAGVARASLYHHFPSKEDLLLAYALETTRREIADIREQVQAKDTPLARFFGPWDILVPWFESTDYRGCPFQNMMADVPAEAIRVREVARQHRESLRAFFQELAFDLKNSSPKYRHLDPEQTALTSLLLFEGAIATAVAYRATWPIGQARTIIAGLLESPAA